MTAPKYADARTDGSRVPSRIRELVRLMIEEAMPWHQAADRVGLSRARAKRALEKPHVIAYRREQRKAFLELLSVRVPHKLNELMDSENAAAAVRATLALEEMATENHAQPQRRIATGGIVIVLGNQVGGAALPAGMGQAMPVIEQGPLVAATVESSDD